MAKIKVTQVKSQIGRLKNQKRTLEALGLRRMNQTVEHEATPSIVGMVNKIEIWNPTRLDETDKQNLEIDPAAYDELAKNIII